MNFKYYAFFHFILWNRSHFHANLPIESFSVNGITNVRSETTIDVWSQLFQVEAYKNIDLCLALTKNRVDLRAALDLSDFHYDNLRFSMALNLQVISFVPGYPEPRWSENYSLREKNALVRLPPSFSSGGFVVKMSLPIPDLSKGIHLLQWEGS